MEIFTLLETIEEMLESSKGLPFTAKAIIDKEEMLDLIKEIRLKLPDELKQAKWVKEERQRILPPSNTATSSRVFFCMVDLTDYLILPDYTGRMSCG